MTHQRVYDKARLDILIYAQDGRGVGHVSRSAAIAMALRRLYPQLKIILLTGYRETQMLLGESPVDWIKLPAYETQIIEGKAKGKPGDTNLKNCYLGPAREYLIESILREFKPRCVLVDHLPGGRRNELNLAHLLTHSTTTKWVLGVRGIPGKDDSFWSNRSSRIFNNSYTSLLWYGDTNVLGGAYQSSLEEHFSTKPYATGYVSRCKEIVHWQQSYNSELEGILSIPWFSAGSIHLLEEFCKFMQKSGERRGKWVIYTKIAELGRNALTQIKEIEKMPCCYLKQISNHYFNDLHNARTIITYGGYNSLSDILAAKIPAVVITRKLHDQEQDEHVSQLQKNSGGLIYPLAEHVLDGDKLASAIETQLSKRYREPISIELSGAENTAHFLTSLLENHN